MTGFLSRIFGGGSKRSKVEAFIEEKMVTLLKKAGFKLSFDLKVSDDQKRILIDLYGEDEAISKSAEILDAFQLILKRSIQKEFPDDRVTIIVDCDSYREQSDDDLTKIAEKLKEQVLSKKKPAYFRALPPRERKIVHQYFSEDKRFRTKSVGDGMHKKIKISLAGDRSDSNANPNPRPKNNNKRQGSNGRGRNQNREAGNGANTAETKAEDRMAEVADQESSTSDI